MAAAVEKHANERAELNAVLAAFAVEHGDIEQRTEKWYNLMSTTIGGSEIAAILGRDSYKTMRDVAKRKCEYALGIVKHVPMPNCWWGTLFEDIIQAYIEIDLGDTAHGTDACICKYPGHRTSPDGYIVMGLKADGKTIWKTTDPQSECHRIMSVLLEFKCPVGRKPTHLIPTQYRPQILSGLALSPMAELGLFVDAVFYKCTYEQLGHSPEYDVKYHDKPLTKNELPLAWGVVAVYANAAPGLERFFEDAGESDKDDFQRIMSDIDAKNYTVRKYEPELVGNRGTAPPSMEQLRADVPENKCLIAIIPWKLFHCTYAMLKPKKKYMEEILPKITELHELVQRALATDDPFGYIDSGALDDMIDDDAFACVDEIKFSRLDFQSDAAYASYLETGKF